jgi:tRNA U55 pseudouridine synthase TruB
LGVGGYLSSLRRTRIGFFNVADAKTPAEIEAEMAAFKQSTTESL